MSGAMTGTSRRPIGPFPRPPFIRGRALLGAYQRGYAAGERGESSQSCPYTAHARSTGPMYLGKSWGYQLGEAWSQGRDDALSAERP